LITTLAFHPKASLLPHFLTGIFYLHSLVYGAMNPVYSPAWSLEIEIQFYCLAPLLAFLFLSRRPAWLRRALLGLFMLVLGLVQVRFFQGSPFFTLSILNYAQYFVAGFLLCDLYLTDWQTIPEHWLWDVASIPLWLTIFASESLYFHAFMPFLTVLVYIGAFKGPLMRWFFRNAFVSTVGGMCYSIYLTHGFVLAYSNDLLMRLTKAGPWPLWILAPIGLLETILCGGVYYVLIEHPCMDKEWPAKLWRWCGASFAGVQKSQER
jgi:peptidoglycan/LPS O-acetylase OafA/YrhL